MIRIGTTQDLAETVGLLRQLAGVTQTALAEVMGCHPARIGEYERHRRKVSVRVALIHLNALGYELAVVPVIEEAPGRPLSASVAAETPSAGVPGWAGGAEAISGASAAALWRTRAINLQKELVETKGPCRIENGCVRHHLHKGPCAFEEAFCCNRGDHPGHIGGEA